MDRVEATELYGGCAWRLGPRFAIAKVGLKWLTPGGLVASVGGFREMSERTGVVHFCELIIGSEDQRSAKFMFSAKLYEHV